MTSEEQELYGKAVRKAIYELAKLNALIKKCHHKIERIKLSALVDIETAIAMCSFCDKSFGWYCPESPDHTCHYYTVKNRDGHFVKLITKELVKPPDSESGTPYNTENKTDDYCIFCGSPEERE